MVNRLKILVCSLSWGIGHSSRMIPLIRQLLRADMEVILASDGKAGELLKTEFPDLPFYEMPSFPIRYSRKRTQTFILAGQIPFLLALISREHRWLKKFIASRPLDIVISDNCYGLFNRKVLSVFVSHQVSPILPAGLRWMEPFIHALLGLVIRSFDRCWIPDDENPSVNLSGRLSHHYPVSRNTRFMGILSRFCNDQDTLENADKKRYDILVILSGPEPQRTLMEEIMAGQLEEENFKAAIVCGLHPPCTNKHVPGSGTSLDYYYHLPPYTLRKTMQNAGIIICRSGYSTIMDLAEMELPAILVPTPGQPEQEYLAGYLSRQGFFHSAEQHNFNLHTAIRQYRSRNKKPPGIFKTDTGNYLKDLLALYEKKKIHSRHSDQETGQNL